MLVRLDKIKATEHVYNIELAENVGNGSIVKRAEYKGEDVYAGAKSATFTATDNVVMLVAPFMNPTGLEVEEDFVLKKGEVVRGYEFEKGDVVTVTEDGLDGKVTVGKKVSAQGGLKLKLVADAKEGTVATENPLVLKVIAEDTLNGHKAFVLEVE